MPLRSIRIICSLLPIRLWILIPRVNTANSRLPISALFHLCGKQEWQHCHHQLVKPPLHAADQVASIGVPSPPLSDWWWVGILFPSCGRDQFAAQCWCIFVWEVFIMNFDFFLWGDKILPKIGLFHGSHMHGKGNVQTRCGQSCLLDTSHKGSSWYVQSICSSLHLQRHHDWCLAVDCLWGGN